MCGLNLSYNCFSIPIVVVNIFQVVLQAIELFFTFHSKLLFLGFWILCIIHTKYIQTSTVHSVTIAYLCRRTIIFEIKYYSWIEALIRQPLTLNIVTIHILRYKNIRLFNGLNENCCFGCRLWLLGRFQSLVCKLILKGLVFCHSEKSLDFSRWEVINI